MTDGLVGDRALNGGDATDDAGDLEMIGTGTDDRDDFYEDASWCCLVTWKTVMTGMDERTEHAWNVNRI